MRDLAPDITRQRLLLEGYYTVEVDERLIGRFLVDLPARKPGVDSASSSADETRRR